MAKKPRRNNAPKPVDRRRDLHRGQQQLECRCFIFMPVSNKYQFGSALALKFLFAALPNEQFQLYFLACLGPFLRLSFPFRHVKRGTKLQQAGGRGDESWRHQESWTRL